MSNTSPSPDELARTLAAIEDRSKIAAKRSGAVAEEAMNQVWDLTAVVRTAVRETEHLADLERGAADTAPRATRRLRLIADVAALCFAEIVAETSRTMRTGPEEDR